MRADVDLLGIVENGAIGKEVSARGTSFYHYPLPTLLKEASAGSLFVSHLVHEAKVIHDTANIFDRVCNSFKWKKSYVAERRQAVLIIRFLSSQPSALQRAPVRKRLVWAMRRIVISKAADQHVPIFGSTDLANFADLPALKEIIDRRSTLDLEPLVEASNLLVKSMASDIKLTWPSSRMAQLNQMMNAGGILSSTAKMVVPKHTSLLIDEDTIDYIG